MNRHQKLIHFASHGFRGPVCTLEGLLDLRENGQISEQEFICLCRQTIMKAKANMAEYISKDFTEVEKQIINEHSKDITKGS